MLFVGVLNARTTNPRWRTATILKKIEKSHIFAATVRIDHQEISHGDAYYPNEVSHAGPYTALTILHSET